MKSNYHYFIINHSPGHRHYIVLIMEENFPFRYAVCFTIMKQNKYFLII